MTTPGRRFAVNPIPYWSKAGKTREVFEEAFTDFAKIGYSAVKADVPDGMKAQEYADWIGSYGLAPAISLFSSALDETVDITEEVERAKRFASTQAELGLDRTMISSMAIPARMARPAVGADFSREADRYTHREMLTALLKPWFAARTADEVAKALAGTSVLHERYRSFVEVTESGDLADNPMFAELDQPSVGRYLAAGPSAYL